MRLQFNPELCHGCKYCELSCSAKHEKVFNPHKARLNIICRYSKSGVTVKGNVCILCKLCMKLCPVQAISFENESLHVDYDKCIQCGICAEKCPKKCIATAEGRPLICDLCDGNPTCVKFCPHGALTLR